MPPYQLGERLSDDGIWSIVTSGGGLAGYIFESRPLAPIPGFAGEPMNMLIVLDREGRFLDVSILDHSEPVFVAGLGPAPFHAFVQQYRGHSVGEAISVGSPQEGSGRRASNHVYLDGVSRATATVRIANQSILAAALKVARERMEGIVPRAAARPLPDHTEALDWPALVRDGIARPLTLTNAQVQAAFAGSLWENDDPAAIADPEGLFIELYVIDIGPPSVARTVLAGDTLKTVEARFRDQEEPILVLANGRQGLVDPDFVRNTVPDRLGARQGSFPVSLSDADVDVRLAPGVPRFDQAMILEADTRLGFDPASPWTFTFTAVRDHGSFRPERGTRDFELPYQAPSRFFDVPQERPSDPAWLAALNDRALDVGALVILVAALAWLLARRFRVLALHPRYGTIRLAVLAVTVLFIGWWGQGQLSIVTLLGLLRSTVEGGSLVFLLYDPFSLVLWATTIGTLAVWGRGFFCGWLCPFGALQEFAHRMGRALGLREVRVHPRLDTRLKGLKYGILGALVIATLTSASAADVLVEVEPFKTAITLFFQRDAWLVAYAVVWLILGAVVFKPFCRYVCPLGAALAVAGRVRRVDWIPRRTECGVPCQFCRAKCAYGAIEPDGRIDYDECFQCLDCVTIIEDAGRCVPERLARKKGRPVLLHAR
jgi:transcriptional regulator of nitric oxide reductase